MCNNSLILSKNLTEPSFKAIYNCSRVRGNWLISVPSAILMVFLNSL